MSGKSEILIDIIVKQIPVSCCFDCPECENEIKIEYNEFCEMLGEPPEWLFSKIECPECEAILEVDTWEFN